jgi:hypothetical protein
MMLFTWAQKENVRDALLLDGKSLGNRTKEIYAGTSG